MSSDTVCQVKAIRRFTVRTVLPESLTRLRDLAINLRWSWHEPTQDLFRSIDAEIWDHVGGDPVRMLGEVSSEQFRSLAQDPAFVARLADLAADLDAYVGQGRWYQAQGAHMPASIAYFSPEYGITEVLPQYSGGLGILAGDHLKAASDLGVPIIGVGLFYRSGYFRQALSAEGWQEETYPVLDPDGLPLQLLREPDGSVVRINLQLPEGELTALVRVAQVGRVPLLLLDTDVEQNSAALRNVTDRLYGGGTDHRLRQELLLGIGGVRAIRAYCRLTGVAAPEVFHTNEGHAGFLGIERIRELMSSEGLSFDAALRAVRAGTVFTTHTPVPAGIDRFPAELVHQAFSGDRPAADVPVGRIMELGREDYEGGNEAVFNMAVMGLRLGQRANGVSLLHGAVSRGMFSGLWSGFDVEDVPITSITNGVHAPTWVSPDAAAIVRSVGGQQLLETGHGWEQLDAVSDEQLWSVKRIMRDKLVHEVRRRVRESWQHRGASDVELGWVDSVLDPDILTIGFARRVPSYKRLTLMLRDPERLAALLTDADRPVQIVVAGKAHPADEGGKRLIQELVKFADTEGVRDRIVFLPDYDIAMAKFLYPGCDVWLNNPLRPLEACGTSGMKAALNGALNVSIRDGWWDEWYDGSNGWAIPTADGVVDPDRRDDLEAQALYELIEKSVAPRFYHRDEQGLPNRWIEMVRHTIASLGPKVLASRMVADYVEHLYVPAALSSRAAVADGFAQARGLADYVERVAASWQGVAVHHVDPHGIGDEPRLGAEVTVHAEITLGALAPADVRVELLHGRVDADDRLVNPVATVLHSETERPDGRWTFGGTAALDRTGPFGYTVRVVPAHPGLANSAELGLQAQP